MPNQAPLRVGNPLDAELAERLRARIRQRGAHNIVAEIGLSPTALCNAAAASHVAASTATRVTLYLNSLGVVPPGSELEPGAVT